MLTNLILWVLVGALAGWIASRIKSQMSARASFVVGTLGALLGGFVMNALGAPGVTGFNLYSLLVAVGGAVILLFIVRLFWPKNLKNLPNLSREKQPSVTPGNEGEIRNENSSSSPVSTSSVLPNLQKKIGQLKPILAPEKKTVSGIIFVSYRRTDSADVAGRIYDRLEGGFGRTAIFKDVDSIPLGLDFKEYLDEKVSECNVLLAIIGDRWLDASDARGRRRLEDSTDFVRIEIESALARGIPIVPVLVRGASMPSEEELPAGLKKLAYRNGIQIRHDPDFHRDMDRLISALKRYVEQIG